MGQLVRDVHGSGREKHVLLKRLVRILPRHHGQVVHKLKRQRKLSGYQTVRKFKLDYGVAIPVEQSELRFGFFSNTSKKLYKFLPLV